MSHELLEQSWWNLPLAPTQHLVIFWGSHLASSLCWKRHPCRCWGIKLHLLINYLKCVSVWFTCSYDVVRISHLCVCLACVTYCYVLYVAETVIRKDLSLMCSTWGVLYFVMISLSLWWNHGLFVFCIASFYMDVCNYENLYFSHLDIRIDANL